MLSDSQIVSNTNRVLFNYKVLGNNPTLRYELYTMYQSRIRKFRKIT